MKSNNWAVFRQDFAGNEFLVEKNLTEERATELVEEYESHKHHQHYWKRELLDKAIDFTELLRQSFGSGSTMEASLLVLRNQNASPIQCIAAVRDVRGISAGESKKIVLDSTAFSDFADTLDALFEQVDSDLDKES